MSRRRQWRVGAVLTVAAFIAGPTTAWASGTSPVRAASTKATRTGTINFGAIVSQSGLFGGTGPQFLDGLQLAVAQLNRSGGIVVGNTRYKVVLQLRDDRSDASASAAAATQLVDQLGVKFIFGPTNSIGAPAVAQLVVPQGVIMLTPATAVAAKLTPALAKSTNRTLFLTGVGLGEYAATIRTGISGAYPKAKRVAIIAPQDATGQTVIPLIQEGIRDAGMTVVDTETVSDNSTDYSAALTNIKNSRPDVLMTCCSAPVVQGEIAQAVQLGAAPAFLAYDVPFGSALSATGSTLQLPFADIGYPGLLAKLPGGQVIGARPGEANFVLQMKKVLHRTVTDDTYALYFYDEVFMLAKAIEEAHSTANTTAIAHDLATMHYTGGALGELSFLSVHSIQTKYDLCTALRGTVKCRVLNHQKG